jgi:hypothetical protein
MSKDLSLRETSGMARVKVDGSGLAGISNGRIRERGVSPGGRETAQRRHKRRFSAAQLAHKAAATAYG